MTPSRSETLITKLEKGRQKTLDTLQALTPAQWQISIYTEPAWQAQQLLAHFVSAENQLLLLVRSIVRGGRGAPANFDVNEYNAAEQKRLEGKSVPELLAELERSRQRTIEWVKTLSPEDLDKVGCHPALGNVTVETIITAIHGHHLMHIRDLSRALKADTSG